MHYTKKTSSFVVLFILAITFSVNAQLIATVEVDLQNNQTDLEVPVQVNPDAITIKQVIKNNY